MDAEDCAKATAKLGSATRAWWRIGSPCGALQLDLARCAEHPVSLEHDAITLGARRRHDIGEIA
jgi:hypothetical protein